MTHAYAFVLAGTVLSQARVRVGDVLRTAGPPVLAAARPAKLNADVPQVLGGPIAAGLLLMDGLANIRGWQWIFIVEGLVTVVVGILLKAGPLHDPPPPVLVPARPPCLCTSQTLTARQRQLQGSCVRTLHTLAPRRVQVHASSSERGRRLMQLWAGGAPGCPAGLARARLVPHQPGARLGRAAHARCWRRRGRGGPRVRQRLACAAALLCLLTLAWCVVSKLILTQGMCSAEMRLPAGSWSEEVLGVNLPRTLTSPVVQLTPLFVLPPAYACYQGESAQIAREHRCPAGRRLRMPSAARRSRPAGAHDSAGRGRAQAGSCSGRSGSWASAFTWCRRPSSRCGLTLTPIVLPAPAHGVRTLALRRAPSCWPTRAAERLHAGPRAPPSALTLARARGQVIFWTPLMLEAILSGSFAEGIVPRPASTTMHAEARAPRPPGRLSREPEPRDLVALRPCSLAGSGPLMCAASWCCMQRGEPRRTTPTWAGAAPQAEHTARLALLSTALYVPAAAALCALAYTSMRFRERNLHCFASLAVSGAAFMCSPSSRPLPT